MRPTLSFTLAQLTASAIVAKRAMLSREERRELMKLTIVDVISALLPNAI